MRNKELNIKLKPVRIGFGSQKKGVPDFIIWINAYNNNTLFIKYPLLIEKELEFYNGIEDFKKYAKRTKNQTRIPFIKIPKSNYKYLDNKYLYEMKSLPTSVMGLDQYPTETIIFEKIKEWCENKHYEKKIQKRKMSNKHINILRIEFNFFAHDLKIEFPLQPNLQPPSKADSKDILTRFLSFPSVVITSDKKYKYKNKKYETRIKLI